MPWTFQKPAVPQCCCETCSKLQSLDDAECEELLKQIQDFEDMRIFKDTITQVSRSSVPSLLEPADSPLSSNNVSHFCSMVLGKLKYTKMSIFSDYLPIQESTQEGFGGALVRVMICMCTTSDWLGILFKIHTAVYLLEQPFPHSDSNPAENNSSGWL